FSAAARTCSNCSSTSSSSLRTSSFCRSCSTPPPAPKPPPGPPRPCCPRPCCPKAVVEEMIEVDAKTTTNSPYNQDRAIQCPLLEEYQRSGSNQCVSYWKPPAGGGHPWRARGIEHPGKANVSPRQAAPPTILTA